MSLYHEVMEALTPLVEAFDRPGIVSAEDAVLTKLEWFDMGGRSSARQWRDIWAS